MSLSHSQTTNPSGTVQNPNSSKCPILEEWRECSISCLLFLTMNHQHLNFSIEVWFRDSTQEWVVDFNIRYEDVIHKTVRFSGNTQLDALREMNLSINEVLQEVIDNVEEISKLPN